MSKAKQSDIPVDELEPVEVDYQIELTAKGGRWHAAIEDLDVDFDGRSKIDAVAQVQARAMAALSSRIKGGGLRPGPMSLRFSVRERESGEE